MTTHVLHADTPVERRFPGVADLKRLCVSLTAWVYATHDRCRQRAALASLDERLLRDIGITRKQALYEATKGYWSR